MDINPNSLTPDQRRQFEEYIDSRLVPINFTPLPEPTFPAVGPGTGIPFNYPHLQEDYKRKLANVRNYNNLMMRTLPQMERSLIHVPFDVYDNIMGIVPPESQRRNKRRNSESSSDLFSDLLSSDMSSAPSPIPEPSTLPPSVRDFLPYASPAERPESSLGQASEVSRRTMVNEPPSFRALSERPSTPIPSRVGTPIRPSAGAFPLMGARPTPFLTNPTGSRRPPPVKTFLDSDSDSSLSAPSTPRQRLMDSLRTPEVQSTAPTPVAEMGRQFAAQREAEEAATSMMNEAQQERQALFEQRTKEIEEKRKELETKLEEMLKIPVLEEEYNTKKKLLDGINFKDLEVQKWLKERQDIYEDWKKTYISGRRQMIMEPPKPLSINEARKILAEQLNSNLLDLYRSTYGVDQQARDQLYLKKHLVEYGSLPSGKLKPHELTALSPQFKQLYELNQLRDKINYIKKHGRPPL